MASRFLDDDIARVGQVHIVPRHRGRVGELDFLHEGVGRWHAVLILDALVPDLYNYLVVRSVRVLDPNFLSHGVSVGCGSVRLSATPIGLESTPDDLRSLGACSNVRPRAQSSDVAAAGGRATTNVFWLILTLNTLDRKST